MRRRLLGLGLSDLILDFVWRDGEDGSQGFSEPKISIPAFDVRGARVFTVYSRPAFAGRIAACC
jgi:hypothetical protein